MQYHIPVRPFSPIDALNRRAAALGSPGYASASAHADYNGHHVILSWNSYRQYYTAHYMWAGVVTLARGSFESCLRAVQAEYARGAVGASASIVPRPDDAEAHAACVAAGLATGDLWEGEGCDRFLRKPFWTWRHDCAVASVRDYASPSASVMLFDAELLNRSTSRAEYEAALKDRHGRIYT